MSRIFKKRPNDRCFTLDLRDANGIQRRLAGFPDKATSQELLRRLEQFRDARRMKVTPPPDAQRWLETQPAAALRSYVELNFIAPGLVAANTPLSQHRDNWVADMRRRQRTENHVRLSESRLNAILKHGRFGYWPDVTFDRLQTTFADMAEENGWSAQTFNHHFVVFGTFARWCGEAERMNGGPGRRLEKRNVQADRKHLRHAATGDEFQRLFAAAIASETAHWGMTGRDRAMLYLAAASTGFRWSELKSMTRGDFDLEGDKPSATVQAKFAKNRHKATTPIRLDVAAALREYFGAKPSTAPAFPVSRWAQGAKIIQRDLKAAGIPYVDAKGGHFDFHSLRHSFSTWLAAAGNDVKTIQQLLRHSTVTLTLGTYTHGSDSRRAEAIQSLPLVIAAPDPSEAPTAPANAPSQNTADDRCSSFSNSSVEVTEEFEDTQLIDNIIDSIVSINSSVDSVKLLNFLDVLPSEDSEQTLGEEPDGAKFGAFPGAILSGEYRIPSDNTGESGGSIEDQESLQKPLKKPRFH